MNPVAPPELRMLENSSIAGVYSINLTQAMPDYSDRSEDGPAGMIFRLQDLQSGNVTYIQLVHLCITACILYLSEAAIEGVKSTLLFCSGCKIVACYYMK